VAKLAREKMSLSQVRAALVRPLFAGLPRSPIESVAFGRLHDAIVNGRVKPGTKLGEDEIANALAITRMRARKVLQQLSVVGLVTLIANRGAFVAKPSVDEAREVFSARRLIEGELAAQMAKQRSEHDLSLLHQHLNEQREAMHSGNRTAYVKLIGEFHMVIAELSRNRVIARMLVQLISQSSIIVMLYPGSQHVSCSIDEHELIVKSIADRNADEAASLMRTHLEQQENRLQLHDDPSRRVTLAEALSVHSSNPPERAKTGKATAD
jgi:DNA-binding GntR family transcriptional regulator